LRLIPWMAAAGVFGLVFVLDQVGVLPGVKEHLIEVNLPSEVPGLRARLRAGAVSADGLKVSLPGSAQRDDTLEVMALFRQLLKELGANPESIPTQGSLSFAERERQALLRRWVPWMGLALGVGALCHLWIRLGTVSRVLVEVAPGERVASAESLRGLEKQILDRVGGIGSTLKEQLNAVASKQTSMESTAAALDTRVGAVDGRLGDLAARVQALATALQSIPVAGEDPRIGPLVTQMKNVVAGVNEVRRGVGVVQDEQGQLKSGLQEVRQSLDPVVQWKGEVAPHLEAFGEEARGRIEDRQRFRERAVEAVRAAREIAPLVPAAEIQWDAGWRQLAREMGVREWVSDSKQEAAIKRLVNRVASGPERSIMTVAAPKVGKGAILKALPVFFGYRPADENRIKPVGPDWFPDTVMGFDGEIYHPGKLPELIVQAILESQDGKCPWVLIDELGRLPQGFGEVFAGMIENLFALGAAERRVQVFHRLGSEIGVDLPAAFRLLMARNPALSGFHDHGEFDGDGAWAARVAVVTIPPLGAASEETLLSRWIQWSRKPDAQRDPGEFFGDWKALVHPPAKEDEWLPQLCQVLQASRVSHNGHHDPGWKYVEIGTGETRRLIWDAAEEGSEGFKERLAEKLFERVVQKVSTHVQDPKEVSAFREVLGNGPFDGLVSRLG
jgi:hypothetical protein